MFHSLFLKFLPQQIDFLLFLQNLRETTGGVFDNFFLFITAFGEINIPVIITAGIYWCIDSKKGMYILWNWCIGLFICQLIKIWACIYRPWILDSRITPLKDAMAMAGGYSFPSGHTQTAVSIWGSIAVCFRNKILRIFLIILILLIGFSRNYIGVHTPQDIIVSLVVGCILLWLVKKIFDWCENGNNRDIIILVSVYLACVAMILYGYFKSYPIDYLNGTILVDPVNMKLYTFPKIGLILGTFSGWFINNRFIGFNAQDGDKNQKIFRFLIGIVLLIILSGATAHLLQGIICKRFCMFITAFVASLFVTAIYPAILIGYKKYFKKN